MAVKQRDWYDRCLITWVHIKSSGVLHWKPPKHKNEQCYIHVLLKPRQNSATIHPQTTPFNAASSLSYNLLCSFTSFNFSGLNICWIIATALSTLSSVSPLTNTCNSSSYPSSPITSFFGRPSLVDPRPRMAIRAPDSSSRRLWVWPRGPIMRPMKFRSGYCCTGMGIFLLMRTGRKSAGGLKSGWRRMRFVSNTWWLVAG